MLAIRICIVSLQPYIGRVPVIGRASRCSASELGLGLNEVAIQRQILKLKFAGAV
jgi:hypothetical protein